MSTYSQVQSHTCQVCKRCKGRIRATYLAFLAADLALTLGIVAIAIYFLVDERMSLTILTLYLFAIPAMIHEFIQRFDFEARLATKAADLRRASSAMPVVGFTEEQRIKSEIID